jgi:predicted DNA-binding transcriptional regulator AlpA
MNDIISPEDTALLLGKSARTLERWRSECVGPAYVRIGGTVGYRRKDIEAFIRASRVEPGGTQIKRDRR